MISISTLYPELIISILNVKACCIKAAEVYFLFSNAFCYSVFSYWGMILGILKTNDIYSYHIIIIIDIGGDGGNSGDGVLYVCVLVHVCYFPSIIFFLRKIFYSLCF